MEKGGGAALGVRARPETKRRRKGVGFAKDDADYLVSDSYMFGPLIDPNPTLDSSPSDVVRSVKSAEKGTQIAHSNRGCH